MPPSRKRAQGKARKAARAKREDEKKAEARQTQVIETTQRQDESVGAPLQQMVQIGRRLGGEGTTITKCKHGSASPPEEERICAEFIEAFRAGYNSAVVHGVEDLGAALGAASLASNEKYAHVWDDVTMMQKVVSFLLCLGTTRIVDGNNYDARPHAYFTSYFELCVEVGCRKSQAISFASIIETYKVVDEHTLVRFFQKRIPCACLDEKYNEVKSITKMGICWNPNCSLPDRKAERCKMLYCTRCGAVNYCSRECQVTDWPSHRACCNYIIATKAEVESKE